MSNTIDTKQYDNSYMKHWDQLMKELIVSGNDCLDGCQRYSRVLLMIYLCNLCSVK